MEVGRTKLSVNEDENIELAYRRRGQGPVEADTQNECDKWRNLAGVLLV